MTDLPHLIEATLREFTDTEAVLTFDDGQVLRLPKDIISASAILGARISLAVFSSTDVASEHERLAKAVLHELLRR